MSDSDGGAPTCAPAHPEEQIKLANAHRQGRLAGYKTLLTRVMQCATLQEAHDAVVLQVGEEFPGMLLAHVVAAAQARRMAKADP